jgi:large subunit ribosomal protein L23
VNKFIFDYRQVNNIINSPILIDKLKTILVNNKNSFLVNKKANKTVIKTALEFLFNIKILKLNTYKLPKKKKQVGKFIGFRKQYKKVIITIDPSSKLNLFTDN